MLLSPLNMAYAQIEADLEVHKIIGGLYALSAAAGIEGNLKSGTKNLNKYFLSDLSGVRTTSVNQDLWIGVPVDKRSTARKFLRAHAAELGIKATPGGQSWIGDEYAWLNASEILSSLQAAKGSGNDSSKIFFTADNDFWWLANPNINKELLQTFIKKYPASSAPVLNAPSDVQYKSIYDQVKPSSVEKPKDIHLGTERKGSYDMEIGDVMFTPIPNVTRYDY